MTRLYHSGVRCSVLAVAVLALSLCVQAAEHHFVLISDVHLDMFYGTPQAYGHCTNASAPPLGRTNCDAPFALVQSAFRDIAAAAPPNSHVVFTGDWLRHDSADVPMAAANAAFRNLSAQIAALPHTVIPSPASVVASLGNNDFIPDYAFNLSARQHPLLQNMSTILREHALLSTAEAANFSKCAYYYRDLDGIPLRFISLNTLIYSGSLEPLVSPATTPDPCGQFAFLEASLAGAKDAGRSAVVMSHIPPIINSHDAILDDFHGFFQDAYQARFAAILKAAGSTLAFQFYGHMHMMTTLADAALGAPGFVIPSITKIFGNNPSYVMAKFDDETRRFHTFRQRFLKEDGSAWAFTANSPIDAWIGPLQPLASAAAAASDLFVNNSAWGQFQDMHAGGVTRDVWPDKTCEGVCRRRFVCSMLHSALVPYKNCLVAPSPSVPPSRSISGGVVGLIVISAVLGVGGIVVIFFRFRQLQTVMTDSTALSEELGTHDDSTSADPPTH